jgi:ferric-dicitrate binding protein FerR (iron transport regulator)
LDGEAFFDVKHKSMQQNARFIVHIPGMDIEVLGTKFNVFNRADKANVVLNTGKVKVRIVSKEDTSSVVMMPDEALEFSRKDFTVKKRQVKAEVLTSWRNRVLIFEKTPLSRIGEMIEETYGVDVIFSADVDTKEELEGTVPSEKLETLLTVLAKSSNLHITRQEDQIIISKHDRKTKNH